MKLDVRNSRFDYDRDEELKLKPMLKFDDSYITMNYNDGRNLTTDLVNSMFIDYVNQNKNDSEYDEVQGKHVTKYGDIDKSFTSKVEINSPTELFSYFDCMRFNNHKDETANQWVHDDCFFGGYRVFVYPYSKDDKVYPVPEAREGMMSDIYVRGNIVSFNYFNVYKYYEWDELMPEIMGIEYYNQQPTQENNDQHEYDIEDTYSFVLVTDNESCLGVTNIFNTALAGVLTNHKTKTITVLNKHQAIHVWYWLFMLCQQYIDVWAEVHLKEKQDTEPIDTIDEYNPYVQEYHDRLQLVDSMNDLEYIMWKIGGVCHDANKQHEYDWQTKTHTYHTETAKIVEEFFSGVRQTD